MKTAEVEINTKVVFKANHTEHQAFKEACKENGDNMAKLLREFARKYVANTRRRKKK
jgi:hypothetical protein